MIRNGVKVMTRDDVKEQLKNMKVGIYKPLHCFNLLIINPDYDPSTFSQEIEDSEKEIDILSNYVEQIKKIGFPFFSVEHNSEKWLQNHSKICNVKFVPNAIFGTSVTYIENGHKVRNYCDEILINKIMDFGDIVKIW